MLSTKTLLTLLTATTPLINLTNALGINCRGSGACGLSISQDIAQTLTNYIDNIDQSRFYSNGEHIACATFSADEGTQGHMCAFLQNTNGAQGSLIRNVAHYIPDHRCRDCGSVPTGYPGSNDVADGELTYNVVGSGACNDGLC